MTPKKSSTRSILRTDILGTDHKDLRRVMEMSNILEQTEGLIDKLPVYVTSFSEEPRTFLSQWRGYCSSGPGFAVCFTADQMTPVGQCEELDAVQVYLRR